MQLGTFTANILVDGKALEEYDVVTESPTKVICWVPSEEGKSFVVECKCHEQARIKASKGHLYADGISCVWDLIHPGTLGVEDTMSFTHFISGTIKRDLVFSQVLLSDDDALLDKEIPKDFGQIHLKIQRGEIVKERRKTDKGATTTLGDNKYHEKSKKAVLHCVGKVLDLQLFGPEIPRQRPLYISKLVPNDEPIMTFVFNYRPLSVLQANGVAPRPTSGERNVGQEVDTSEHGGRILDHAILGDIKPFEVDGHIQNLENQLKRLREWKASNSEEQKLKRIKREEPGERRQPLFTPGEVIDLT